MTDEKKKDEKSNVVSLHRDHVKESLDELHASIMDGNIDIAIVTYVNADDECGVLCLTGAPHRDYIGALEEAKAIVRNAYWNSERDGIAIMEDEDFLGDE